MEIKVKTSVIFACAILFSCILLLLLTKQVKRDDSLLKLGMYPSGSGSGSYYFVVDASDTLFVSKGTRIVLENAIAHDNFLAIIDGEMERKLTDDEISMLVTLADNMLETDYIPATEEWDDGWNITLFYKGKHIKFDYWEQREERRSEFINFIDYIMGISPIPVIPFGFVTYEDFKKNIEQWQG